MESRVPHHIPGVSSSIMVQPLLDSRVPYGRLQHPLTIYPIDQMKSLHVENDYIDSPAVVSQQPPPSQKVATTTTTTTRGQEVLLGAQHHPQLPRCEAPDATTHPWISFSGRPSSISSSSSTSSDQRLLEHAAPTPMVDPYSGAGGHARILATEQPKLLGSKAQDLKTVAALPPEKSHAPLCEKCGKCRCTECTLPRTLPSCWVCNQECLCSAQNLVDSATCMCLVKGVFYHCTEDEDEEGSCADKPCSCSHSNCCARWSFMAAVSLVLPCLVCYLPAVGCAKLSQKCYDSLSRPGCRCKNAQACKVAETKACPVEKQAS